MPDCNAIIFITFINISYKHKYYIIVMIFAVVCNYN